MSRKPDKAAALDHLAVDFITQMIVETPLDQDVDWLTPRVEPFETWRLIERAWDERRRSAMT